MKRSNKLYILLGVLAAACVVTFGVVKQEEKKEKIKNSDETILEVPGDSVKTLSWQYAVSYTHLDVYKRQALRIS